MPIRYIDLFCGIGGFRIAAQQVFNKYGVLGKCVFSCDIDEYARRTYFANFAEMPSGDIQQISSNHIPEHDLLFAGFPCQPFSIIGNGKGFDDTRGTLFFEITRIINSKKPNVFILENVKRLVTHNKGRTFKRILSTLRNLGYKVDYRIFNALNFGLPQKRERVYIVGYLEGTSFKWPESNLKMKPLSQILENNVEKKYYASDRIRKKRKSYHKSEYFPSLWHENKSGNISSYPYSCALRAGASYNYLLVNGERRLTPREMLSLQGFPKSYKIVVPDAQIRKQTGNAVPVNVVRAILESILTKQDADHFGPYNSIKNNVTILDSKYAKRKIAKA